MDNDLEAGVRRNDPDRWLSSRLISERAVRANVLALYAFDGELAKVRTVVSEPLIGEIRLTWWQEAVDEIISGRAVRAHPVVQALAIAVQARDLSPVLLNSLIEARFGDLEEPVFDNAGKALTYLNGTSVALAALVLQALCPQQDLHLVRGASRAYGLACLLREARLSPSLADEWALGRIHDDLAEANSELEHLPVSGFPAVAHCGLARSLGAGTQIGPLAKRAKIFWASLTGHI